MHLVEENSSSGQEESAIADSVYLLILLLVWRGTD